MQQLYAKLGKADSERCGRTVQSALERWRELCSNAVMQRNQTRTIIDDPSIPSLPRFYLLSDGLEVALHAIHTDRDAIDERERFRVLGQDRREHT
jgi:hypothetical protein